MNFIIKTLTLAALTLAPLVSSAQYFEDLDGKMMPNPDDFVDPGLVDSRSLGTLPGGMGTLKYAKPLHDAEIATQYDGWGAVKFIKRTVKGKEWVYQDYLSPNIYYIISELPSGARYYGIYTSGYESIYDVAAGSEPKHPFTKCYAVYGTLVNPDGTTEPVIQYTQDEWKKLTIAKPTGVYYMHDFSEFKAVEVTFNAGGTGKLVYSLPRSYHQAPQEFGGSSVQRYKSGRVKKVHRNLSGGYRFYIDGKATQTMKWKLVDGVITIERTGKPTFNVGGGIDFDRTFANMTITASDRRIEEGKHRQDFPTNEYVLEAKEMARNTLEQGVTNTNLYLPVLHLTKNEIMLDLKKDNRVGHLYWVLDKSLEGENILSYCYDHLNEMVGLYADRREYGVKKLYEYFTRNVPSALASAPAPLSQNTGYYVGNIDPAARTGKILFTADHKVYKADLAFDSKWHLDNALVTSSLKGYIAVEAYNDSISANNAKILEYKKDKRRSKIVKNYEKEAKRIEIPASFTTIDDYYAVRKRQDEMLALQKETLSALE